MTDSIPNYLEIDYSTLKERLKDLMKSSDTFKDYNYEGANITMLIEMFSYMTDLNVYYINKLAKNIYPESSEVYETTHSIASIRGYDPKGWIAPNLNLNVSVLVDSTEESLPSPGEQLLVPAWYRIQTDIKTDDGDDIYYMTVEEKTIDIPETTEDGDSYEFTITLKEGNYHTMEYTEDDIVENKIILPFYDFDFDVTPYSDDSSIVLYVNNEIWTRVDDFRSDILSDDDKIYKLEYDKHQRYNIVFSSTHTIPEDRDVIKVIANRTHGPDGDIYARYVFDLNEEDDIPVLTEDGIEIETQRFLQNISRDVEIPKDYIEISNPDSSFNSSMPETIDEIKRNSSGLIYSQYRNVNSRDYRIHLDGHPDVAVGNAWGEADIDPQNTEEYNKVYISVIPSNFDYSTITTSPSATTATTALSADSVTWNRTEVEQSEDIVKLVNYTNSFKNSVLEYLENRKSLSVYEIMTVPELVYFAFDIGLIINRAYNFTTVKEEIKSKLEYYFDIKNRQFNETIDFKELQCFLLDTTIRDFDNETFQLTRGVKSIVFRDVLTYTPSLSGSPETIYEPNESMNYPMFTKDEFTLDYSNTMRPIELGLNQFPVLSIENCVFINER